MIEKSNDKPQRIVYSRRIRFLEWAVKRLGLWDRYRAVLGFPGLVNVPLARHVILGVPVRCRIRAAWCVVLNKDRP